METITLMQIAGLAGFVTYLAGFGALQFGWLDGNSCLYSMVNIVAASLVLFSLTEQFNLASALIQISWIVIGIGGLIFRMSRRPVATSSPSTTAPLRTR